MEMLLVRSQMAGGGGSRRLSRADKWCIKIMPAKNDESLS